MIATDATISADVPKDILDALNGIYSEIDSVLRVDVLHWAISTDLVRFRVYATHEGATFWHVATASGQLLAHYNDEAIRGLFRSDLANSLEVLLARG